MKKLIISLFAIYVLITFMLISAYSEPQLEYTVEDSMQRQYWINCLRLNDIDFALKDDGTVLFFGDESIDKLHSLDEVMHDASVQRDLDICRPNN